MRISPQAATISIHYSNTDTEKITIINIIALLSKNHWHAPNLRHFFPLVHALQCSVEVLHIERGAVLVLVLSSCSQNLTLKYARNALSTKLDIRRSISF